MQPDASLARPAPTRTSSPPHASLAHAISRVWGVEQVHGPQSAMPDGCVDLIVALSPEPMAFVVGALKEVRTIDRMPGDRLVGLSLEPGFAAAFLGRPANEFVGREVRLDRAIAGDETQLLNDVRRAETFAERATVLQAFVGRRIAESRSSTRVVPLVQEVVQAIRTTSGTTSIAAIAKDRRCSVRLLQRAFQQHVGISPKSFARIVRFHAAVEALRRGRRVVDVAFDLGYADQSHFIRDFQAIAGSSPSSYARRAESTHLFNTGAPH